MFIDFPRGPAGEDQESNININGHEDVEFYREQTWLWVHPTGISNHDSSSGTLCASLRLRSIVRDLAGQDLLHCGMVLGRTRSAECLKVIRCNCSLQTEPLSCQFLGNAQESSYIAACFVTGLTLSSRYAALKPWQILCHARERIRGLIGCGLLALCSQILRVEWRLPEHHIPFSL